MDLGLKGKKVIVTGGSRGLGLAALEQFASEGADIDYFSRNAELLTNPMTLLKLSFLLLAQPSSYKIGTNSDY